MSTCDRILLCVILYLHVLTHVCLHMYTFLNNRFCVFVFNFLHTCMFFVCTGMFAHVFEFFVYKSLNEGVFSVRTSV
jgi:hypothetical protein